MGDQIQARLQSQAGGLKARESVGEVAVNVIRDHPLTGVGVNNYAMLLSRYTPSTQWAYVPHNKFLLVWSETGLLGLLAFVGFLGAVLRRSWVALRAADDRLLPYAAALSAGFVALVVDMNVEPFHGRQQLMLLFLLAALLYSASNIATSFRSTSVPRRTYVSDALRTKMPAFRGLSGESRRNVRFSRDEGDPQ